MGRNPSSRRSTFGHHALQFSFSLLGVDFCGFGCLPFGAFFTAHPVSGVYYLMIAQSLPCWSHSGCCELETRKILSRNVLNYDAAESRSHINVWNQNTAAVANRCMKLKMVHWLASWWSLLMLFAGVRWTWRSSMCAKFNYHRFFPMTPTSLFFVITSAGTHKHHRISADTLF